MEYPVLKRSAIDTVTLQGSKLHHRGIQSAAIALIVMFLSLWHVRVTGHISWLAFGTLVLFVFVCLAYGNAFIAVTASLVRNEAGLPFQFLSGFLVFNTLLFFVSLVSPYGMLPNVAALAAGALFLVFPRVRQHHDLAEDHDEFPGLLCIVVVGVAATLWCSDAQTPLLKQGENAVYQTWQDSFFHVRQISAFAQAHGIATVQNTRMSEVPAQIYHYASYLSAAAVHVLAHIPAIDVYTSFQLPLGIFLAGLAAFSLIASIWGVWPALAASVAVVLVPDAYQQGFENRYLSYNFLSQVNLGMLYGIACAAMAWIFVLEGSRRGKIVAILVGYLFLAACLFYKAHIFVANSYLMLIYPCLFFVGIKLHRRLIIAAVLTAIFVAAVGISQTIGNVPVLRLDGSGIGHYIVILLRDFDEGLLKTFFTQVFMLEQHSKPVEAAYVVAMLMISTFGLWCAAMLLVVALGRAKAPTAVLGFPLLVIANYLVMSIGLALDTTGVGTPDELMNRPLVWAYFAVVVWTAGGGYFLVFGNELPRSRMGRLLLFALLCIALTGPLLFSKNIQTFPAQQGYAKYEEFNAVPLCLVQASRYIRNNSRPDEIIQDSENDPRFVVTALSERQLFAGESIFGKPRKKLQKRLDGLADFRAMNDAAELRLFAASHNISWYLLHPDNPVAWPESFLSEAVFDCDGYRVYHFAR
ncbi:MAG: hypothetical protein IPL29_12085 [Propionivibrio sp.]|uniref:hypothetical protein n=1 Tax=Propionivibrio sp. TaxID=2212460 RepID=UPI0025F614BC|nr:hypothetical protein [Propionivibrio sp.]MBK8401758.1 hypothetical protein [Propionivibrio sp.]MBL0209205.1 hypothetical protein [Propionivibrio sp.]